MLSKDNFKDLISYILVAGLFILALLILKPIILSIIYGILLAYIFYPVHKKLLKWVKNENLSASIICLGLLVILISTVSLIFFSLFNQAVGLYLTIQKLDITSVITNSLPDFLKYSEFSASIVGSLNSYLLEFIAYALRKFTDILVNIAIIMIQLFVVFFVFYFGLRDGEKAIEYFRSISPLKKEVGDKFFKQFKDITNSVLLGMVVIGVIQGIIAGIGYFIFGVPNAAVLTILTIIAGIIPVIGPWFIWIPADIYLFAIGKSGAGIGLLIYGLTLVSLIDNFIRPIIVSRKTEMNSAIVLIGMIGGPFVFGVVGLLLGPLILAYVLLVIELYRKRDGEDIIFKKVEEPPKN